MIKIKLDSFLKEKGVSQRELSRRTGIRQPTISEMCLNTSKSLPIENLNKICIELDCELTDIIEYKKEQTD
ncbi:helix-turn-helix domain-containing protein [Metabacillus halosaccharovorans]|uniref:helix-turn-helix domain-containing protein n=1 Tax=Metabacillus halosaccharovorans TaxID=930124 RepID=UPI002040D024|nr:helix-turn-helix transcriptional regulator [Metabacillus halosaccharovorans]MCM3444389.1 helix-turn-helix transcriptional regulator [Metabacillus halosaccharovorans]